MPLYRDWVFNKLLFTRWVVVAIEWQYFAFEAVVVYLLWDGQGEIAKGGRGLGGVWGLPGGGGLIDFVDKVYRMDLSFVFRQSIECG